MNIECMLQTKANGDVEKQKALALGDVYFFFIFFFFSLSIY